MVHAADQACSRPEVEPDCVEDFEDVEVEFSALVSPVTASMRKPSANSTARPAPAHHPVATRRARPAKAGTIRHCFVVAPTRMATPATQPALDASSPIIAEANKGNHHPTRSWGLANHTNSPNAQYQARYVGCKAPASAAYRHSAQPPVCIESKAASPKANVAETSNPIIKPSDTRDVRTSTRRSVARYKTGRTTNAAFTSSANSPSDGTGDHNKPRASKP